MQLNSFQKNGLLNIKNGASNNTVTNNFGRRSVQDIRDDMWKAKETKHLNSNSIPNNNSVPNNNDSLFKETHKDRVDNLKNFNRWK